RVVITCCCAADGIGCGQFRPFLGAHQVVPAMTFTEQFTAAFRKDVVDVDGGRCGSGHCSTAIFYLLIVAIVLPAPFAGTSREYIAQLTGGHRSGGTLHGCLGSDQVDLGELGNVPGTSDGS